jgi:dienelactone hydrolase
MILPLLLAGLMGPDHPTTPLPVPQVPWHEVLTAPAPRTRSAPGFESGDPRIRAVFESVPWQGRSTTVFAWIGVPDTNTDPAVPAMVLVHGGGGTAFAEWVRLWVDRGYAAIAMDTCGCVPRGEYADWERHDSGGPPGWGGFDQIDGPVHDHWTYHAVSAVIRAHTLLRQEPGVDPERIGITGISWGGYLTCITAGLDQRFRFAVPVYGCGFLGEDSVWIPTLQGMGEDRSAEWLRLWDPSRYLSHATMPMLWVTGTNDFAYPMGSLQRSYRLPASERRLCVRVRMPHGHGGTGENPDEIRAFADTYCREALPLIRITEQLVNDGEVRVRYRGRARVARAELNYTLDTGAWQEREWLTVDAELDRRARSACARVPDEATAFYINLVDDRELVVSSEHQTRP